MTSFGWETTAEEALAGCDLTGKRVLVTGVSAGIGTETARVLVQSGAEVIGAARNLEKARQATGDMGDRLRLVELDLASLASVRACADGLVTEGQPIDVIIANAGMLAGALERTVDGFESQLGCNHLGHFLLVNRVEGLLRDGGRVVNLSSLAHRFGDIDLDDPNFERRKFDTTAGYGAAKTATVLFTVELDRRWRQRGVRAVAVHPGAVATDLAGAMSPELVGEMMSIMLAEGASAESAPIKDVAQGAATSVWAAFVAPAELVGGQYCEDCQAAPVSKNGASGVQPYAVDPLRARRLWALSEELVGERFGGRTDARAQLSEKD